MKGANPAGDARVEADPRAALAEFLLREGPRLSFFQVVRLIQALFPDAPRVGNQGPAPEERVRFRADLSLAFPPGDIREIVEEGRSRTGAPRFEVVVSFLGLYGPASPLPTFYTEDLLDEDPEESHVRRFLDLFHHRAISLFYRAWEKYRYEVRFLPGGRDEISRRLLSLAGLGTGGPPIQEQASEDGASKGEIPSLRLLAYLGLLSQRPRSASALLGILDDYFEGIPFAIEQCVPQLVEIPEPSRNLLGVSNAGLGVDLSIGERVLDRSSTLRIRVGPLDRVEYHAFLPGGAKRRHLERIVQAFLSDALDYEIELWIRAEETPSTRLSSEPEGLGWSTWLGGRPGEDQWVRFLAKRADVNRRLTS